PTGPPYGARWAAVPSLPAIAVTVWRRRRIIILSIRRPFRDCGSRAACREKFAAAYLPCHVLLPSWASAPGPPGHLHLFFQYASELIGRSLGSTIKRRCRTGPQFSISPNSPLAPWWI